MMELKQIAKLFGLSVDKLAKEMGYSRQALYEANMVNMTRLDAAINNLVSLNNEMLRKDQLDARIRFKMRSSAIKELRAMLSKDGRDTSR